MKTTVIIPTYNEAGNIERVLRGVAAQSPDEVLVVDGGSTDGTVEKAAALGYTPVRQAGRGLGDAIKTGIKAASGEVIVIVDADCSHDTSDIPKLLAKIEEGYDLVVASRYISQPRVRGLFMKSSSYDDTFIRALGNRIFTWMARALHGVPVHDILMGFKAFRKSIFEKVVLTETGQQFDAEIVIKAQKAGFRLGEVPTVEYRREYGESKLSVPYHGFKVLWVIIKERFVS